MTEREKWENVAPALDRIRVPGGWLYQFEYRDEDAGTAVAMVFVPLPPHGAPDWPEVGEGQQ